MGKTYEHRVWGVEAETHGFVMLPIPPNAKQMGSTFKLRGKPHYPQLCMPPRLYLYLAATLGQP